LAAITGSQIVAEAEKFRGVPYVWGGVSPSGFDCSGLVKYVLTTLGVKGVPRTSEDQWNWVDKIPASQAQAGDLVFFSGSDGSPSSPGHVGIVVAPGTAQHGPQMIDAPYTGTDVQVQGFDPGGTGVGHVVGYGRPPGTSITGGGTAAAGGGGILQWPADITGFFSDADHALGTASTVALALFQPSTYIRAAVGGLALILLIAGLIFLVKAAAASG
jgi:cell wall-associated NlpC family hydrolase